MSVLLTLSLTAFFLLATILIFFAGYLCASASLSLFHAVKGLLQREFRIFKTETKRYRRRVAVVLTEDTIDLSALVLQFRNGHEAAPGQHRKAIFA